MAAIPGNILGYTSQVFHSTTAPAMTTAAGIATFIGVTTNAVPTVTAIGDVQNGERAIVEYNVFGSDDVSSLLGQRGAVDWSFDVAFDQAQTKHSMLRDAGPTAVQHFVVHIDNTTANNTTGIDVYFTGFITSAPMTVPVDGVVTMTVNVRLTSALSWTTTS